ncbi:MAG: hypothetical protein AAFY28_04390, partial [Actinomycetota bacterium]
KDDKSAVLAEARGPKWKRADWPIPANGELVAALDEPIARRYELLFESLGSAVGKLEGNRCVTCHLSLSPGEVDTARDDAAGSGFADCPQCERLLVV